MSQARSARASLCFLCGVRIVPPRLVVSPTDACEPQCAHRSYVNLWGLGPDRFTRPIYLRRNVHHACGRVLGNRPQHAKPRPGFIRICAPWVREIPRSRRCRGLTLGDQICRDCTFARGNLLTGARPGTRLWQTFPIAKAWSGSISVRAPWLREISRRTRLVIIFAVVATLLVVICPPPRRDRGWSCVNIFMVRRRAGELL